MKTNMQSYAELPDRSSGSLLGFGDIASPARSLRAKVGEKPKPKDLEEPPEDFFEDDEPA